MRSMEITLKFGAYEDGSGHRQTVRIVRKHDGAKLIQEMVEIDDGVNKIVLSFKDWFAMRDEIDAGITDVGGPDTGVKSSSRSSMGE